MTRTERIQGLTRAEVLEAALALEVEVSGQELPAGASPGELSVLQEAPLENIAEVEELARWSLIVSGDSPELADDVDEILDAVGKKAFVFGGAEIAAAAAIGALVLHIWISEGRSGERQTRKYTVLPNGSIEIEVTKETTWGVSGKLVGLVKGMFDQL